ncbi:MAG TPA: CoA-acylating methylmalonate-semialdehyde dehydrogenase [Firmicutes bacterium]|nr:CoA-acylating methylmalonate-semialdehyde dehydrogenase [Bacillota bacterium]
MPEVKEHYGILKNYIEGKWVDSASDKTEAVINPATGKEIARVPMSTRKEVDDAVAAAKEAWWSWRETPPVTRARMMFAVKELLEQHFEEIARIMVQENGKTIDEARGETRRAIENVEVASGITTLQMGYSLEDGAGSGIDEEAIRQPLGVFACIAPFNFPAMIPFWFWPYAVACGNTYVIKPSRQVPCTMQYILELIDRVGFPPGVINLINGSHDVADALMEHPDIKGISFVGSTPVARHVYKTCAQYGKRVQAQGGAKNCLVVMSDAVLPQAVSNMLSSCFGCAGQRCLAGSNLLIMEDIYDEFKERFIARAKNIKVGYGLDESVNMGPVISAKARAKILDYIEKAISEGGRLLLDGRDIKVEGYPDGFFIGPTVFENVTPDMTIAKEEVFGPVVSLMKISSLDEAIDIIHSSPFGNAASIYTQSGKIAREFKYRVQAGNIGINLGIAAPMAYFPFAGYKDSFFGDLHGQGMDAINFFTDRKVVITRWI